MNTKGHHGVAEAAGLPLLREAFGEDARSLQAFYMGNWLTDVSQAVDPIAYGDARDKAAVVEDVFGVIADYAVTIDRFSASIVGWVKALFGDETEDAPDALWGETIDRLKGELREAIEVVFLSQTDERTSVLGEFFRSVFLVVGYFKFVHPAKQGEADRMDFRAFLEVFGQPSDTRGAAPEEPAMDRPGAYTQYYPFEHLDRPKVGSAPATYAPGLQQPGRPWQISGPPGRPGPRSMTRPETIRPHLYSYLRDNMECTAGLLAEVDKVFARVSEDGFDDTNRQWHLTLAKLGHALHQVEDFFAHSNWVELAACRLGSKFTDRVLGGETSFAALDHARTIFDRRLKRYVDWPKGHPGARDQDEPEDWVVTGYFDTKDTILSLAHLAEEGLGLKADNPWLKLHEAVGAARDVIEEPDASVAQLQELLRDALEFATVPEKALKNSNNAVASKAKGEFEEWARTAQRPPLTRDQIVRLSRTLPMISEAPPEILAAFVNAVVLGSRANAAVSTAKSLYDAITAITGFAKGPVDYILDRLPKDLANAAKGILKYYARELAYEELGSRRIGCHSLLAKDHGSEPFFEYQRQCATAVHWYVVKVLLRNRSDPAVPRHIDWLELLENFLRNPSRPDQDGSGRVVRSEIVGTILIRTEPGDQLDCPAYERSLARRFGRTATSPRDFSWHTIADANFPTRGLDAATRQKVINNILSQSAYGRAVAPPNYAFRPGTPLLIPQQRLSVRVAAPAVDNPEWWVDVMIAKDWRVFKGEDHEKRMSIAAPDYHKLQPITPEQHRRLIDRGAYLRQKLREKYRPDAQARSDRPVPVN